MGSSSSSRGLAVVRGPLLAGSDHRGAVPEPARLHVLWRAVRQGLLHCEDPLVPVRQAWGPPVVQRRTGGVLSIHECGHTDGRCGEDDEAAKWEEKGRARLEQ